MEGLLDWKDNSFFQILLYTPEQTHQNPNIVEGRISLKTWGRLCSDLP